MLKYDPVGMFGDIFLLRFDTLRECGSVYGGGVCNLRSCEGLMMIIRG